VIHANMVGMATKRYTVNMADDDPADLEVALQRIAVGGGRVVSVMWAPARITDRLKWASGSCCRGVR
jgi:hypothetical protein